MRNKVFVLVTALLVSCSALVHITSSQKKPSPKQDRIIKHQASHQDPVKVLKVKNKNGLVNIGGNTFDDDDWLRGLTVSVKNTSGKSISFVELEFHFTGKEKPAGEVISGYHVIYGKVPSPESVPVDDPVIIPPNETVDVVLSDDEYVRLQAFLDQTNYPESITEIDLTIREVIFNDNTKWISGSLFRRDQSDPDKWHLISSSGGAAKSVTAKSRASPAGILQFNKATFGITSPLFQSPCGELTSTNNLACNNAVSLDGPFCRVVEDVVTFGGAGGKQLSRISLPCRDPRTKAPRHVAVNPSKFTGQLIVKVYALIQRPMPRTHLARGINSHVNGIVLELPVLRNASSHILNAPVTAVMV